MAGYELESRQLLEHATHDQARQRQTRVERPADAGRQAELFHAFLAEADRGRMHEHRDVELAGEPEERPRIVVVRIGAAVAGADQHAAQIVLFHRSFELAEMIIAAARDRDRKRNDLVLMLVA